MLIIYELSIYDTTNLPFHLLCEELSQSIRTLRFKGSPNNQQVADLTQLTRLQRTQSKE